MNVVATEIPGLLVIEPRLFEDARGFFLETYQQEKFRRAEIDVVFVQDNLSRSKQNVLRGLHYQIKNPQGKLCQVVRGEVFDVVVDLRRGSPTWGRWSGIYLSEWNHRQLFIPPGLAHGFCVISDVADFFYKCTDYYYPEHERTLLWNDPEIGIDWPVVSPLLSEKDQQGLRLSVAPCYDEVDQ